MLIKIYSYLISKCTMWQRQKRRCKRNKLLIFGTLRVEEKEKEIEGVEEEMGGRSKRGWKRDQELGPHHLTRKEGISMTSYSYHINVIEYYNKNIADSIRNQFRKHYISYTWVMTLRCKYIANKEYTSN